MWPGISGTVGETTLTVEQIATHSHQYKDGHSGPGSGSPSGTSWGYIEPIRTTENTGGSQPHTHSLSGVSSEAAGSLPPYYAGQYVIRV